MRVLIEAMLNICKVVHPSVQVGLLDNIEPKLETALKSMPKIVCLCGSAQFMYAYHYHNHFETLAGNIVLTVGCFGGVTEVQKQQLDELHKRKIDLCDEILVLNVGEYIGESTASEIQYAESIGKKVRYAYQSNAVQGLRETNGG
jgi:hypothetical protein